MILRTLKPMQCVITLYNLIDMALAICYKYVVTSIITLLTFFNKDACNTAVLSKTAVVSANWSKLS